MRCARGDFGVFGSHVADGLGDPFANGLLSVGLVSAVNRAFRGPRGRRVTGTIEHTAPLVKGSSGGPVLDLDGGLIGLNTNRLGEGFYAAIPADADLNVRAERVVNAIDERTAFVSLSHVLFKTSFIMDVPPIVAAFLVGFSLASIDHSEALIDRLHLIGYALFIPVFYISVGLETDLLSLFTVAPGNFIVAVLVVTAIASKVLGGFMGGVLAGFGRREAWILGLGSSVKLAVPVAATYAALKGTGDRGLAGGGEHQQLVHGDRDGVRVAEHVVGGAVADQDDVDAGGLDRLGAGMVVRRDHDDRLAQRPHLGELGERGA